MPCIREDYFDRIGPLPPLPAVRIVALLRAALVAVLLLSG
jgi:hypothetical protein